MTIQIPVHHRGHIIAHLMFQHHLRGEKRRARNSDQPPRDAGARQRQGSVVRWSSR